MVFHGDYEVEFEIYEIPKEEGEWRYRKLGRMPGLNAQEAKNRWIEQNSLTADQVDDIVVLYPLEKD